MKSLHYSCIWKSKNDTAEILSDLSPKHTNFTKVSEQNVNLSVEDTVSNVVGTSDTSSTEKALVTKSSTTDITTHSTKTTPSTTAVTTHSTIATNSTVTHTNSTDSDMVSSNNVLESSMYNATTLYSDKDLENPEPMELSLMILIIAGVFVTIVIIASIALYFCNSTKTSNFQKSVDTLDYFENPSNPNAEDVITETKNV